MLLGVRLSVLEKTNVDEPVILTVGFVPLKIVERSEIRSAKISRSHEHFALMTVKGVCFHRGDKFFDCSTWDRARSDQDDEGVCADYMIKFGPDFSGVSESFCAGFSAGGLFVVGNPIRRRIGMYGSDLCSEEFPFRHYPVPITMC
eukprot:TRINITY_DN8215_c0_g1_i1.p2 TRINITY_DN8215_c0_g1~~TRINITY_DN8215_c0_g1_i1.p2  ORF type:complete len:146 (-),score=8.21 TRINITY_DN8215_c0_g1_i1:345-782(-)